MRVAIALHRRFVEWEHLPLTEKTGVGGRVWGVGVKRNSSRK